MEVGTLAGLVVLWVVGSVMLRVIGPSTMNAPNRQEARQLWRARRSDWGMATKIGTALLAGVITTSALVALAGAVLTAVLFFRG